MALLVQGGSVVSVLTMVQPVENLYNIGYIGQEKTRGKGKEEKKFDEKRKRS